MMKKRISLLLTFVIVLAAVFSVVVYASEKEQAWILSEDRMTLSNGIYEYTYFEAVETFDLEIAAENIIVYENALSGFELRVNANNPEIVWLIGKDTYLYATEKGTRMIEDLIFLENIDDFCLNHPSYKMEARIPISLMTRIENEGNRSSISASILKNCTRYEVRIHDESGTLSTPYGAFYLFGGEYCFVNYLDYEKALFDDDDENFIFIENVVEVCRLDKSMAKDLEMVIDDMEYVATYYKYVESYNNQDEAMMIEESLIILFWVGVIIIGFVFPIPFLVLGLVFPRSKKMGYPKYWYVLALIAALWIFLAVIISVLLILA